MKIRITIDLDKYNRIGIANFNKGHWDDGDNPPADYKDCKSWIEAIIDGELTDLPFYQEPEPDEIEERNFLPPLESWVVEPDR